MTRLLLLAAVAMLVACAGPRAVVLSAQAGEVRDAKTVVGVELENRGGDGSVELVVTVRDGRGAVVGRTTESVSLEGHERVRVGVEVAVAGGATRVTAEARAVYPEE